MLVDLSIWLEDLPRWALFLGGVLLGWLARGALDDR